MNTRWTQGKAADFQKIYDACHERTENKKRKDKDHVFCGNLLISEKKLE